MINGFYDLENIKDREAFIKYNLKLKQMKIKDFNPTYTYVAEGRVLGNFWGGGKGSYKARQFVSKTSIDDLIETLNKALKDDSLDSGMGYESLIGACLDITITSSITIEGKRFHSKEVEKLNIGEMTEDEIEFTRYGIQ